MLMGVYIGRCWRSQGSNPSPPQQRVEKLYLDLDTGWGHGESLGLYGAVLCCWVGIDDVPLGVSPHWLPVVYEALSKTGDSQGSGHGRFFGEDIFSERILLLYHLHRIEEHSLS